MKHCRPEEVGVSSQRLSHLDTVMQRYVDEQKVAGVLTLVARRGSIIHQGNCGWMDLENQKPMLDDTLFRIYSMTKPITSTAVMMLFEEGRFFLSDPVSKFIPGFKDVVVLVDPDSEDLNFTGADREITIHDLLTHTAGLAYGLDDLPGIERLYKQRIWPIAEATPGATLEKWVLELTHLPLAHQPGTAFRYSMATDVLGYLIQLISGMPLQDFLKQRIFEPLGMTDTAFHVPPEKVQRLAGVYGPNGEGGSLTLIDDLQTNRFLKADCLPSGGGGLVSTSADYVRFAQFMLNKGELDGVRLLGCKTVELMTMNHLPPGVHPFDDLHQGFGLGVSVQTDIPLSRMPGSLGTYGWSGAANTTVFVDPQEELIGLLMLQFMPHRTYPIIEDFTIQVYQALID